MKSYLEGKVMSAVVKEEFDVVIGLETHVQMTTKTKCPVCLALPGSLPVLNKKALEYAIRAALALNCKVHELSIFARKNYFYPDLPKGYQISQYDKPLATDGYIDIKVEGKTQRVRIHRLHMEEDAGKTIHEGKKSYVDLNRAGTPLMEIVTEPDITSAVGARLYLEKLRNIMRYIEVSDADMEKGQLRCDVNISLKPKGSEKLGTKVEIKNLNSFRFVHPDLLPVRITVKQIEEIKKSLPELPDEKEKRYVEQYGLTEYDAGVLVADKDLAIFFEETVKLYEKNPKAIANWIINELLGRLNDKGIDITQSPVKPEHIVELVKLIDEKVISGKIAKDVFNEVFETRKSPKQIVEEKGLKQITNPEEIRGIIEEIIKNNPKEVEKYRAGNTKLIGFFVGQVMKATKGKANPQLVNKLLQEMLNR